MKSAGDPQITERNRAMSVSGPQSRPVCEGMQNVVDDSAIPARRTANRTQEFGGSLLQWLFVGSIALTVLALCGAHAPARVKLLGLFAIVCGGAAGGILAHLANGFRVSPHKALVWVSVLLIVGCQVGMSLEAWRIYAGQLRREFDVQNRALLSAPMPQDDAAEENSDPELRARAMQSTLQKTAAERRRKLDKKSRFSSYLLQRVSALGNWSAPWPMLFWSMEVLLASLCGTWLFSRMVRQDITSSTSDAQQDGHDRRSSE